MASGCILNDNSHKTGNIASVVFGPRPAWKDIQQRECEATNVEHKSYPKRQKIEISISIICYLETYFV